jgi:chemotaxis protein CheD
MSEHYLYPGMLFADSKPHRVTTVLGSCIAVCLFDPLRGIGGINHYMLPLWNGEGLPTPRYGNVAIDALIERLQGLGCQVSRMQAKLFGGAAMWESGSSSVSVGERNIDLAWRLLDRYGIQVVASDLGGCMSRKLIFFTASGEVLLKRQTGSTHVGTALAAKLPQPPEPSSGIPLYSGK